LLFGLATVAIGQPTIYPPNLKLGAVLGSRTPVTISAVLNYNLSISGSQDITTFVRYATSPANWLTVTVSRTISPARLDISADPSSLPEGTHVAQIMVYVGQYSTAGLATVSFVVAPGSNPAGLAASPSALTFVLKSSTDPQTLTISNAPGITGAINFAVSTSSHSWLAITQLNQTSPGGVKVQVFPSGLSPGLYSAAVIITTLSGKNTVVPVTMMVPEAGLGPNITLTPAQRSLTFNYQIGSNSNPTQTVYVSTDSTEYTYFTASTTVSWLAVAPAAWIAPASTATCFAPGLFYVVINPAGLSAGVYHGSFALEAPGLTSVELPVTLTVSANPVLNSNPSFVTFDSATNVLLSTLSITASTAFFFTASVSSTTPWLKVSSTTGVASADAISLILTASTANIPSGTYNGEVTLTGPGGVPTLTIPVQLEISGTALTNPVRLSPETVEFSVVSGDTVLPQYLTLSSDLGSLDNFSIASIADGGWLTVESLTSPYGYAKVTVNTAGPPGLYSGKLSATSLVTGDSGSATVILRSVARTFTATPNSLTFRQSAPGAAIAPQEVQVTSNRATTFQITGQPDWATVQAATGLTTPTKLVVSVNPTGMLPGQYDGVVRLIGFTEVAVPISLTIPAPAPPTVAPQAVTFAYDLGGLAPSPQTVTVSNPTGAVRFSVDVSTADGVDWLTANPKSGTTPGAITLTINVARLTPGQHAATLTIAVESVPAKTLTVPVALTVRGSAVTLQSVLNKATMQPTALSPGLVVTLIGLGLGPETPVAARPSPAGSYDTQLAGVQVWFDGVAAPLLLVSSELIHAIVPYSMYGRTSLKVQGQNGRGPALALNADSTLNSVLNPAKRGAAVTIYITGEGQTDPPGQDGRIIRTDLRTPLLTVTATIGGSPATVLYAGSAPESVSGICQVNVRIPEDISAGSQPVEIQIGGAASQRGVTIEVQ
jgi:hypothetical protein